MSRQRSAVGTTPMPRAMPGRRVTHAPDYLLLTAVIVLAVIGLIAVYSSSYALGETDYGDPNYFVKRQGVFLLAGIVVMLLAMRFPYHRLRGLSPLLMLAAVGGLMAVLLVGVEANGAQRWITVGS
ncbi:MAG: FtsW/RodA/SpoVE family cell cycle protein, partial [Dehalococcoidia bacterium]